MNPTRRRLLQHSLLTIPLAPRILSLPLAATAQAPAMPEQWYWYPGHNLTIKATGKQTGHTCAWMLIENSPREGVPFHYHLYEDESFYVIDGLFEITIGDTTITGGPGTYAHSPRNVPHRWTNLGAARGRLLNVFTPSGIEEYFLQAAIPVATSSTQAPVDLKEFQARTVPLRQKYGIVRTGPLKFPTS